MKKDDFRANHAHLVDKERWRLVRRFEDRRIAENDMPAEERLDLAAAMVNFAEEVSPEFSCERELDPDTVRLARMLNAIR